MHLMYQLAGCISCEARWLHQGNFNNQISQCAKTFITIYQRISETGSLMPITHSNTVRWSTRTAKFEDLVLHDTENPEKST